MTHRLFPLVILAAFAAVSFLPAQEDSTTKNHYTIDPVHSMVIFRASHMGISHTYGRFNDISGNYKLENGKLKGDSIQVTVKAASVDTGNEKRDQHLKSPDFLNANEFPDITFKGKSALARDNMFNVTGTLTLHGVSKDVAVIFTKIGEGKNQKGQFLQGYEGTFTIDRADYGMKYGIKNEGDGEVTLTIAIEAGGN